MGGRGGSGGKNTSGAQSDFADSTRSQDKSYLDTAQRAAPRSYALMTEKMSQEKEKIDKLDLSDPDKVEQYAVKFLKDNDPNLRGNDPACHNVAGVIAKIFDAKHIPYTVYIGSCPQNNMKSTSKDMSSHTWIVHNDKVYEHFPKHDKSEFGKHTPYYIYDVKTNQRKRIK